MNYGPMHIEQTITIVEDNPRDREYLGELLSQLNLQFATSGEQGLQFAGAETEPFVISDIQMPVLNGIDFARSLWQQRPAARILFWSQYDDEMYVRSLAKIVPPDTLYGYILKSNPSEVIEKAISAVFVESQCWIDPKVRPVQARLRQSGDLISDIEYEALIDVAIGLTDKAIARRRYLTRRGVQNRLKCLYEKLGVDSLTTAADHSRSEDINPRMRAVNIALQRGLLNNFILQEEEKKLQKWISQA